MNGALSPILDINIQNSVYKSNSAQVYMLWKAEGESMKADGVQLGRGWRKFLFDTNKSCFHSEQTHECIYVKLDCLFAYVCQQ